MMIPGSPSAEYEGRIRDILIRRDWEALRRFTKEQNEVPDDVYEQPQHFWEVLLHKLTCNRIDLPGLVPQSRKWLEDHGYTTDLGGF